MRFCRHKRSHFCAVYPSMGRGRESDFTGTEHTEHVAIRTPCCQGTCAAGKTDQLPHSLENCLLDEGSKGSQFVCVHRSVGEGCNHFTCKSSGAQATPQGIHEFCTVCLDAKTEEFIDVIEDGVCAASFKRKMHIGGFGKRFSRSIIHDFTGFICSVHVVEDPFT